MPSLAAVQAAADTSFDALWTTALTRQSIFLSANSRYFQGLKTTPLATLVNHASDGLPVTGTSVPILTSHPTDQTETWVNFAAGVPGTLPCSVELTIYRTPTGTRGFAGRCWIRWNSNYYYRTNNSGAETFRTHGWRQATSVGAGAVI